MSLLISSHCFDVKLSSCQLASAYEQEASWAEHILLSSSAFINSTRKELSFGPVKSQSNDIILLVAASLFRELFSLSLIMNRAGQNSSKT